MPSQRVINLFEGMIEKTKELINEYQITHEEFHEFEDWLDELGRAGEIPLFLDVFFETHVLNAMYSHLPGTEPSLLGPYYKENSPLLEKPYVLTQREDEKGDVLYFSGTLRSTDGKPLSNTLIDMWQADSDGEYSQFADGLPEQNLRGRFYTDEKGNFEVRTVIPAPYKIPTNGPTGKFLNWIDHHAYRPAHLHFKISPEGYDTLITQVFFEGDPWLETDVAEGVRNSLVLKLNKHSDEEELKSRAVDKPFYTSSINFELRPQESKVSI